MTSPIADLSYRNYDGPLDPPLYRWWAIAKVSIRDAFKKKMFWVLTIMGGFWYVILMIIFYFADALAGNLRPGGGPGGMIDPSQAASAMFKQVKWDEQFLHAFSMGQLGFFIIALLIGVGTIANDNRANALLVYLSKPCTKMDYIVGKWVGIFVPMAIAVGIPTFFFYGYCFMSYRQDGFLHDPWLFFRLILLVLLPATFHASVALGISSMFKQGRVAGATYAGLYFFTLFFTKAMGALHIVAADQGGAASKLVDNLFYFSVDGLQIGLAKDILQSNGGQPFPFAGAGMNVERFAVPAPNGLLMAFAFLAISAMFILLAFSRVRAVEVVQ